MNVETQFDDSAHQQMNIKISLQAGLEKLRHEKFPQGFPKPIQVLEDVDASVDGQWEQRLQQTHQDNIGKRIILIPYNFENSHWIGILIEFKQNGEVERAEFIDPVTNSKFVPDKIQKQFNKIHPGVILISNTLQKHHESKHSAQLTIQNLLKRTEESQLVEAAYQNIDNLNGQISDNQQNRACLVEDNSFDREKNAPTMQKLPQVEGNKAKICDSLHESTIEEKVEYENSKDLLMKSLSTEQQIEQYESSDSDTKFKDSKKNSHKCKNRSMATTEQHNLLVDIPSQIGSLDLLKAQLLNALHENEISDENELNKEIMQKKQEIQELENKGKRKTAEERQKVLSKLEDLQKVVDQIKDLERPQYRDNREALKKTLASGLLEYEINDENELQEEIIKRKQEIQELENKGKRKTAEERREALSKFEDLQKLVDQIKELESSQPKDSTEKLKETLASGLLEYEINDENELKEEIMKKKQEIEELERKGKRKTAEERREVLSKLEDLQKLADQIKDLERSQLEDSAEKLKETLASGLLENEINDEHELQEEIMKTKQEIQELENKGKRKTAYERREALSKLENLQKLVDQITDLERLQFRDNIEELKETLSIDLTIHKNNEEKGLNEQIIKKEQEIQALKNDGKDDTKQEGLEPSVDILVESQSSHPNTNDDSQQLESSDDHSNVDASSRAYEDVSTMKESVKILYNDLSCMPPCAEKSIINLMFLISLELMSEVIVPQDNIVVPNSIETEIEQEFEHLNERLEIEEMDYLEIRNLIGTILVYMGDKNWKFVYTTLERILKLIRPLNIQELFRLVKKVDDAALKIKGEDIILFLGGTGAGKSTTMHFLGGSKLVEIRVKGMKHIKPVEIKNVDLKKITTTPFARSETRYIIPITVHPKDVGGSTNDNILLCDSPGFEDTTGPEVDIANGIGIVKAIKACKSVKPVVLLSYKSMGDRLGGVKDLAHTLVGLFREINDHLKVFSYIFTKFPLDERDTIHASLVNIQETMNVVEKADTGFTNLLAHLIQKTKRGARVLDPIKDDRGEILDELTQSKAINRPDEAFKFSITEKSKSTLQEQVRKHQLSIIVATKRSDYLFIKYKLDQLKSLNDVMDLEYIKQIYYDCTRDIIRHLTKEYEEGTSDMARCLMNQTILNSEDIYKYQTCINHAKCAEELRETHLRKEVVHSTAFIQYINQQIDTMIVELQNKEINDPIVKINLDKIKFVSDSFSDIDPQKYVNICHIFDKKLESVVNSFNSSVLSNKFDDSAIDIKKVHEALLILQDHLDCEDIHVRYNQMKEYFFNYINDSVEKLNSMFDQEQLNKTDIDSLNSCVSMLETVKNTFTLQPYISREVIEKIYENLLSKILNLFEGIVKKINTELKNENAFCTLEQLLIKLDSLRKISVIELKTTQAYDSILEKIVVYLGNSKRDAEQLLRILFQREGKVNYDKLTKCLLSLKSAKWIEKYRAEEYSDVIRDVEEQLMEHIKETKTSVMEVTLDLDNYNKIDSVYKIVTEINEMKQLEKFLSDIGQHINVVNSWFEDMINNVCTIIKDTFNVEKLMEQEHKNLDFNKAEKAFHYLDSCKKIRASFQNNSISVFYSLEECARYYCNFIQEEMKSCFDNIKQFQNKNKEEMFENARILSAHLQEVSEIKIKYPHIFSCISNKTILEQWQKQLSNYQTELAEEMKTLSVTQQTMPLKNKLLIINALRMLDSFLNDKKYTDIYSTYQNELLSKTYDASEKVVDAIQKHDYVQVAREMAVLKVSGDVEEYFFKQAKQALTRGLDDFIEETKTQAIMIGNNLEIERIKTIVENLKRIKQAKQFVSQYLNTPDVLDKCVEDVKLTIEKRLKHFLERVNVLIDINNFYEAEQKIDSITLVRGLLDNYCTKEVFDQIEQIKENQNKVVLDNIVEKYSNIDIDKYIANPPTDIFDKFGAAKSANPVYSLALDKIKENIVTKFRLELELAKSLKPPNPNNSHIRKFESAVKYLPEAMKNALEVELKNCKDDINLMVQDNINELQDAISTEDPETIRNILEQNKISQSMSSYKTKGRDLVLTQVKNIADKIDQHFEQDDIHGALALVPSIYKYKNELDTVVTDIRQIYLRVRIQIKNKFQVPYRYFMHQFLQNNAVEINDTEKSFLCLIEFIKFNDESKNQSMLTDMLPEDFNEKIIELNIKTSDFFTHLQKMYEDGLDKIDIASLKDALDLMYKWNSLIMKMRNNLQVDSFNDTSVQSMVKAIRELTIYPHMLKSVSQVIQELKDEFIHQQLINSEIKEFSQQRDQFYRKLNEKLLIIDKAKILSGHDLGINVNAFHKACLKSIETKITDIVTITEKFLTQFSKESRLVSQDYDYFNLYYSNLLSIRQEMDGINCGIDEKINKIEKIIFDKIRMWEQIVENESSLSNISTSFINMKCVSNNIPLFKVKINQRIDETLNHYKNRTKGSTVFSKLGIILIQDLSGIGQSIIAEHRAFQGYALSLFNDKTQKHDINYVLNNLKGDFIDKTQLKKRYDEFQKVYDGLVKQNLKIDIDLGGLISDTKLIAGDIKQTSDKIDWDSDVRDRIPKLLAHIFALWTLKNADSFFEAEGVDNKDSYLFKPHAAQVVSILRMLGIGDEKEELKNNLVQIGTGEGKSVTLGATASILALLGFDVYCACYSQYLSQRDYKRFLSVFDSLGIIQYILYGTFTELCEYMINRNGDIRQLIEELISRGSNNAAKSSQRIERAKILLIDEVDIFFNQDFYGNFYRPSASLRDPTITSLFDFIWQHRKSNLTLKQVKATDEYKTCCNRFPTWEPLILEAVKDIIYDVYSFESHDYVVKNDKIGYKEQDDIIYNIIYDYKTLFAYYCEHEKGKITAKSLEERVSINIKCGSFSYAEIPLQFDYIMGVTGTLETLSDPEKYTIQHTYEIAKNTYTPSVFGANNLVFREKDDIMIENIDDYFNVIRKEIDDRLVGKSSGKRAILVFFESKQKLKEFYESKALETIRGSVALLTEEASLEEKEIAIKRATTPGQITLFTRTFGRGTDFICYDQSVAVNGGAHVIQTFLSEEYSEEVQIKGRTARQGDYGSYSMVLLDRDLEKFLIQKEDIENVKKGKGILVRLADAFNLTKTYGTIYDLLHDKRTTLFKAQYETNTKYIQQAKQRHVATEQFLAYFNSANINYVRAFLVEENKGANTAASQSRTICLMDATGSMSYLLHNCKNTVGDMFKRTTDILKGNNISEDSFQIQFVVYRNYNCREDKILQNSPWETRPDNLRAFMNTIGVEGGWGNEAIEIGLWYANSENQRENITQVILIGDAPPNTKADIKHKRNSFGETYWEKTKFAEATYYKDELEKLKAKHIPVHAFFVDNRAEDIFKKIAKNTGGRCERLDINSPLGADRLTDLVTEVILKNVGGDTKGTELVEEYRKKFGKSYA